MNCTVGCPCPILPAAATDSLAHYRVSGENRPSCAETQIMTRRKWSLLTRTGRHFCIFSGSLRSSPFSEKMLVVLVLVLAHSLHTWLMSEEQELSSSDWAAAADTGCPTNTAHTEGRHQTNLMSLHLTS